MADEPKKGALDGAPRAEEGASRGLPALSRARAEGPAAPADLQAQQSTARALPAPRQRSEQGRSRSQRTGRNQR